MIDEDHEHDAVAPAVAYDDDANSPSLAYAVDIVLVIDVTGSMGPVLEAVKQHALRFDTELAAKLDEKSKRVDQLRVRVIAFRDFGSDSDALDASDFFVLPDDRSAYAAFVNRLTPGGGGDAPESGLDAFAYALDSPWVTGLDKRRHVVVVFTDAPSHPLAHAAGHPQYPRGIASTMDELYDRWEGDGQSGGMESNAKRLLLFTPDGDPWTGLGTEMEYAIHYPSQAGRGIVDHDYDSILDLIAGSV
jgi:hypothetical protein